MTRKSVQRYIDRELSWLAFNARVLQEAADPAVPAGERLAFLGIWSSNLDEFFRVRVASLRSLLRLKRKRVAELGLDPARLLGEIHVTVAEQQTRFGQIFRKQVLPALAGHGIALVDERQLTAAQTDQLRAWFESQVRPLLEIEILGDDGPSPFLHNRQVYLVVQLWPDTDPLPASTSPTYALVRVPSPPLPRFVVLEGTDRIAHPVIFLDDVIRANLDALFPGQRVRGAWAVKLTRDAELYLDDEFAGDIVASIRKSLSKRETGLPSRFLYDMEAPHRLVRELTRRLELQQEDLVIGGRYHNLHDLCDFPRFDLPQLSYSPLPALPHAQLDDAPSLLGAIGARDHLLHFPYQRFDTVIRLLEEAAADPDVREIWITLYRVAKDSAVAEALIHAAERGKRVTAFVELKARFDEETNLAWAERMERAGVRTLYSLPGLKVHAKLALIVRREAGGERAYAYLGTGNFNERTARVYADSALLTADPAITRDVRAVFAYLAGDVAKPEFSELLVAPFHLRKRLYRLIEAEAEAARAGRPAGILLKLNSLEDARIIERLYDAAAAGVPMQLIVRGICCLVPGEDGLSETIAARSIIDRYLEHARVFCFANGGQTLWYLASADWMTRNLSRRVEVAFPVKDPALQRELRALVQLQLADNVKARILNATGENAYAHATDAPRVRAQPDTYRYLQARVPPREPVVVTGAAAAAAQPESVRT